MICWPEWQANKVLQRHIWQEEYKLKHLYIYSWIKGEREGEWKKKNTRLKASITLIKSWEPVHSVSASLNTREWADWQNCFDSLFTCNITAFSAIGGCLQRWRHWVPEHTSGLCRAGEHVLITARQGVSPLEKGPALSLSIKVHTLYLLIWNNSTQVIAIKMPIYKRASRHRQ